MPTPRVIQRMVESMAAANPSSNGPALAGTGCASVMTSARSPVRSIGFIGLAQFRLIADLSPSAHEVCAGLRRFGQGYELGDCRLYGRGRGILEKVVEGC